MLRPALTVARRGQQSAHHLFIGIRRLIGQIIVDLFRGWRQSGQIIGDTSEQCPSIRWRRWLQFLRFKLTENEGIDRVGNPGSIPNCWNGWGNRSLKSPVLALLRGNSSTCRLDLHSRRSRAGSRVAGKGGLCRDLSRPRCPFRDPLAEQLDLIATQLRPERHSRTRLPGQILIQQTLLRLSRSDRHTTPAPLDRARARSEVKPRHPVLAVARPAALPENIDRLLPNVRCGSYLRQPQNPAELAFRPTETYHNDQADQPGNNRPGLHPLYRQSILHINITAPDVSSGSGKPSELEFELISAR